MGPSQTHFSPSLAARAKMSLSRAQNIFMPANINSIVILEDGIQTVEYAALLLINVPTLLVSNQFLPHSGPMLNQLS